MKIAKKLQYIIAFALVISMLVSFSASCFDMPEDNIEFEIENAIIEIFTQKDTGKQIPEFSKNITSIISPPII